MTIAEIIVFILLIAGVCFILSPLQKSLEKKLYDFFRRQKPGSDGSSIIDVTNTIKKDQKDE